MEKLISSLSDLELKYFYVYRYQSLMESHKSTIDKEINKRKLNRNYFELKQKISSIEKKSCPRCGSSKAITLKKDLNYHDPDSLTPITIFKMLFKGYKYETYNECEICSFMYE